MTKRKTSAFQGSSGSRATITARLEELLVAERDKNDILRNALNEILAHASHDTDGRFYYLTAQKALEKAR